MDFYNVVTPVRRPGRVPRNGRGRVKRGLLMAAALLGGAGRLPGGAGLAAPPPTGRASAPPRADFRNVRFYFDERLFADIRFLRGTLVRTRQGVPPTFDDRNSFIVQAEAAEIAMTPENLSYLMNRYVFAYPGSPVKKIEISIEGGRLKQTGIVHKGADLPFEMVGEVGATADGKIRIHPTKLKAEHVPVKGVLHLFGLGLDSLINPKGAKGVAVDHNDLILDPEMLLPPPHIHGRVTQVMLEGGQIVQVFGGGRGARGSPVRQGNYMAFRGGVIRFGKLTMNDSDLQLIDDAPATPFAFSLEHYRDQLVAGYVKNTPSLGLQVFMPDFTTLRQRAAK
jgi:hypothetical protein